VLERRVLTYEKKKDGDVVAREVQDFRLRHYEPGEVTGLLVEAGFVDIEVCGDYSEGIGAASAQQWLCYSPEMPSGRGA
jgi:hypothetical protein